jgi:integrase
LGAKYTHNLPRSAEICRANELLLFSLTMEKKKLGDQFPMPVTHGSVTVRVHRIIKKSGYVYYQIRHYVDGQRKTKSCSDFAEAEKMAASIAKDISAADIHDFVLSLDVEPRTRNNFRMAISNLVGFAQQRRYVPRNYNPMPDVPRAKEISKRVEVFTVEEMTKLLQNAKPTLVPFLCLIAFGGLRHEEAARLDWSNYMNGHIHVPAELAKCRRQRLVEVQPNLVAWLEPFRKSSGPVQPFVNVTNELVDLAKAAGVEWKHNALPWPPFVNKIGGATTWGGCTLSPACRRWELVLPQNAKE